MMDDPVAILVPVLRRPQRVQPFIDSLAAATLHPYRLVFLCNDDDESELAAIRSAGADHLTIPGPRRPGDYARKINHGYRNTTEPLIFLGADDIAFHLNWLPNAVKYLSSTTQVVGTNDLGNPRVMAGYHSTHTLVTRHYVDTYGTIDRAGIVLTEDYDHCFTDDEFVQTAIARRKFAYAQDSIVEHLHANWGKSEWDDNYAIADRSIGSGRRIFNRRRRMWYQAYMRNRVVQPGHKAFR